MNSLPEHLTEFGRVDGWPIYTPPAYLERKHRERQAAERRQRVKRYRRIYQKREPRMERGEDVDLFS